MGMIIHMSAFLTNKESGQQMSVCTDLQLFYNKVIIQVPTEEHNYMH